MEVITMTKKDIIALCEEVKITIPKRATKKQLVSLLADELVNAAAVITTDKRVIMDLTDKPTGTYIVNFTVSGYQRIRAESDEAASQRVYNQLPFFSSHDKYSDVHITDGEIVGVEFTSMTEEETNDFKERIMGVLADD
jgi:uncharacterized ubiquitin-like protein YukD